MYFFPTNDPEEIMWKATTIQIDSNLNDEDFKERFRQFAYAEYGEDNSNDIYQAQKKLCNKLDMTNEYLIHIIELYWRNK